VSKPSGHLLLRTVGVAAVAATLVAGCSSSDGGNKGKTSAAGGGNSSAAAPAGPKPTGSPIKIGIISSLTGSQASSSDQADTVGPAWAAWINANGGINSHPVQVFSEDDGGDPAKAQAAEKKLVDQDQVLAILVGSDNLISAFDADALGKGVPLVSGTANSSDWYTKAGMFPTVTDVVSGVMDQMLVAKQAGKAKHFANLYCAEIAACAQATQLQKPVAAKLGVKFSAMPVSATATSYTAQCLQLQQEGVDYAQLNFSTSAAAKFIQDCQAQNYNPTWGSSEQAIGKDLLKVKGATVFGPAYAFPSAAASPAVKTFQDAMKKYAKGDNWKEGTASFTWVGLELLHKALAGVGASPARSDVMTALNSVKDEDLGGLLPNKVTFVKGKPVAFGSHPCAFVVGIKDGKTVAPSGLTPVCPSA
jgi:branched-chain amino acid transport system substrate-binding protein